MIITSRHTSLRANLAICQERSYSHSRDRAYAVIFAELSGSRHLLSSFERAMCEAVVIFTSIDRRLFHSTRCVPAI